MGQKRPSKVKHRPKKKRQKGKQLGHKVEQSRKSRQKGRESSRARAARLAFQRRSRAAKRGHQTRAKNERKHTARLRELAARERAVSEREAKLATLEKTAPLFAYEPSDAIKRRESLKSEAAIALANHLTTPSKEAFLDWAIAKTELIDEIGAVEWQDWIEQVGEDYDMGDDGPYSIYSYATSAGVAEA